MLAMKMVLLCWLFFLVWLLSSADLKNWMFAAGIELDADSGSADLEQFLDEFSFLLLCFHSELYFGCVRYGLVGEP